MRTRRRITSGVANLVFYMLLPPFTVFVITAGINEMISRLAYRESARWHNSKVRLRFAMTGSYIGIMFFTAIYTVWLLNGIPESPFVTKLAFWFCIVAGPMAITWYYHLMHCISRRLHDGTS